MYSLAPRPAWDPGTEGKPTVNAQGECAIREIPLKVLRDWRAQKSKF